MDLPSSLLQAIWVRGFPRALHTKVTAIPSVARVSELLSSSIMSGGTAKNSIVNKEMKAGWYISFIKKVFLTGRKARRLSASSNSYFGGGGNSEIPMAKREIADPKAQWNLKIFVR